MYFCILYRPSLLLELGAIDSKLIVENGEFLRLIYGPFIHAGVVHIASNTICLNMIMKQQERLFGTQAVMKIYIFSMLLGGLWSALFLPKHICVGASGAIFGLIGGS